MSLIHSCADSSVTNTIGSVEAMNATFGVIHRSTREFIPILKAGEALVKSGKFLYIKGSSGYDIASRRMELISNRSYGIRWANHLCFLVPGQTTPRMFKLDVTARHSSKKWAS